MPVKFSVAAAVAVIAAVLVGIYFFVSGDAPSTASRLREVPPVPAALDADRRQALAAALNAGHATCLQDLDLYRNTAATQIIRLPRLPALERYVEPTLLAEAGEAYAWLSEHPKNLERVLLALRDATAAETGVGGPPVSSSAPASGAVSQQDSEAVAEARRVEVERMIDTLRGSEYGGDLIARPTGNGGQPEVISDVVPQPDAVAQRDAEERARVQREESERLIEELRRQALAGPDNGLIALESADGDGAASKRKEDLIVEMESFCEDILRVARNL